MNTHFTNLLGWSEQAEKVSEAVRMAVEALELKTPKKPMYKAIDKYIKNRFITDTLCPSCAREIVTGDMYCIGCGQAIDWEEE